MSTDHNFWRERKAKADSNQGPSAYHPNALLQGQTGSQIIICGWGFYLFKWFIPPPAPITCEGQAHSDLKREGKKIHTIIKKIEELKGGGVGETKVWRLDPFKWLYSPTSTVAPQVTWGGGGGGSLIYKVKIKRVGGRDIAIYLYAIIKKIEKLREGMRVVLI